MPPVISDIFGLLGSFIRVIGFLAVGYALGRLVFEHFKLSIWQLQAILILGLFGLLIGVTAFSSAGSAGAFAIGVAAAHFATMMPRKAETPADAAKL